MENKENIQKDKLTPKEYVIYDSLPVVNEPSAVYFYSSSSYADSDLLSLLDRFIRLGDELLSNWLNITTRTLRNYRSKKELTLKSNLKEQMIMLLSLYKHGISVFGSRSSFESWLAQPNVFLDNLPPSDFLNTASGVQLIDNRLTALEYGENV